MTITRRAAALGLGAGALAGCVRAGELTMPPVRERRFPQGFFWGVATSAFQIEGALDADGRGQSVWDVFPREKIADRSDAATANDSYHRYGEDVALIADAGLNAYRFSIAWPRIVPSGQGAVNEAGLDYYARLADALLARGVTPFATLFHWDLPQALQERGGWAARETAQRFAEYASIVGARLGDRIKHFCVMNEAAVHAVFGYALGTEAPGLTNPDVLGAVIHHENLAQGLAMQALRAARSDFTIGSTLALQPSRPGGGLLKPLNEMAARGFDEIWNGGFLDPLLRGAYPQSVREMAGAAIQDGDLAVTRQPVDFLGVNYYAPTYIRFDASSPAKIAVAEPPAGAECDAFGRHIDAVGLYETLMRLKADYGNPRVLITENGCSDPFSEGPAVVEDTFRVAYLRHHLEAVKSAMEAGADVGGYFHWTLVDNWEWAEGYRAKFGLVAQDRATGARTPKASYAWYSALARGGALDQAPA